jgi:hypothetical protein
MFLLFFSRCWTSYYFPVLGFCAFPFSILFVFLFLTGEEPSLEGTEEAMFFSLILFLFFAWRRDIGTGQEEKHGRV